MQQTSSSMTKSRDEMVAFIAEEWVESIDIGDYLRSMLIEYTDELEGWPDDQIIQEYKLLTDD